MELQVAAAKIGKYAVRESGDTLEMTERPHGGLSFVLVDGQSSGRSARIISNLVARKAIALLAEGARDGVAARAAHDYLRTHRRGQVSAELFIVSVDLVSSTLVISRNARAPAVIFKGGDVVLLDQPSETIGLHPHTKPVISEMALEVGLTLTAFTDGVWLAGERYGESLDVVSLVQPHLADRPTPNTAQVIADTILTESMRLDRGRPADDMSVLVVQVVPLTRPAASRHLSVSFPLRM